MQRSIDVGWHDDVVERVSAAELEDIHTLDDVQWQTFEKEVDSLREYMQKFTSLSHTQTTFSRRVLT